MKRLLLTLLILLICAALSELLPLTGIVSVGRASWLFGILAGAVSMLFIQSIQDK